MVTFSEQKSELLNPRDKCCWQGKYFFDAFKAVFTRVLFSLHAMIAIWQVTLVTKSTYWLLSVSYAGLLIETFVVLLKRRGQEWRWFQFSIFLFLCITVPPIWMLELNKLGRWGKSLNVTDFSQANNDDGSTQSDAEQITVGSLNTATWTIMLEQGLVVIIVIGRWLMPKGELTREELSALLLTHLGTAADIVDFLSLLSEPNIVRTGPYLYAVLAVWTVSLLQFPFVVTATAKDDDDEEENKPVLDYDNSKNYAKSKGAIRRAFKAKLNWLETFFETEMWGIFVSLVMQDGPFVVMRLIALAAFKIITYTNYFFTTKNALVLMLQVYRMISIFIEYRKKKKERLEEKKIVQMSKLYVNAFQVKNQAK